MARTSRELALLQRQQRAAEWSRNGTQLTKTAELPIGHWCQGIAWSTNAKTLLVQCMVEEEISVIRFSGLSGKSLQKVGSIKTKGGPAGIRTAEPVANSLSRRPRVIRTERADP